MQISLHNLLEHDRVMSSMADSKSETARKVTVTSANNAVVMEWVFRND